MIKRIGFCLLAFTTQFALADDSRNTAPYYHGNNTYWQSTLSRTINYYIGVGALRDSSTLKEVDSPAIPTVVIEHSLNGFSGMLFHGVQFPLPANFGVSLENTWLVSNSQAKFTNVDTQKLKKVHSVGLSVLPSYQTYSLGAVFLRLGIVHTLFQDSGLEAAVLHFKESVNGGQFGVGYNFDLNYHFSARAEYDYTKYKKFYTLAQAQSLTPSSNEVMLSVLYHF